MRRPPITLITLVGCALLSAEAHAQSHTRGLLLGIRGAGASLEVEDGERQSGGGGGLQIGFGVSSAVSLFLSADAVNIDITNPDIEGSYTFGIGDLGIRLLLGSDQGSFRPYLQGSVSGLVAAATVELGPFASSDIEVRGSGFSLGGGFQLFLARSLALDAAALFTSGGFNELKVESVTEEFETLDAKAGRLALGLVWYPMTPR
jgi:hypothetical protein